MNLHVENNHEMKAACDRDTLSTSTGVCNVSLTAKENLVAKISLHTSGSAG